MERDKSITNLTFSDKEAERKYFLDLKANYKIKVDSIQLFEDLNYHIKIITMISRI